MWVFYNEMEKSITVTGNNPTVDDLIEASAVKFKFDPAKTKAYFEKEHCSPRLKLSAFIPKEQYNENAGGTPSVVMRSIEPNLQPGKCYVTLYNVMDYPL